MAITKDYRVDAADIQSIYNSFNSFIGSYGGSIAQFTSAQIPAQNSSATASQINTLYSKVKEFRADTYLKTQLSFWPENTNVTAGTDLISASNLTNVQTAVGNFSKVKCRNNATNNYSTHSQTCSKQCNPQSCSNSTNSNTCSNTCSQSCSHGTHSQTCSKQCNPQSCSNSTHSQTCSQNCVPQGCNHGTNSNTCSNTCSNVTCVVQRTTQVTCTAHGVDIPEWCMKNPDGRSCNHTSKYQLIQRNYSCSLASYSVRPFMCIYASGRDDFPACGWGNAPGHSACSQNCGNYTYTANVNCPVVETCSQACSNGTHSQTCSNKCNPQSCNNGTNSNTCSNNCNKSCSNSTNSNTCSNTCSIACSNSKHSQTCSNNCNKSCSNSTNSNTCANTTVIDILCAQNPKTNSTGR